MNNDKLFLCPRCGRTEPRLFYCEGRTKPHRKRQAEEATRVIV